MVPDEPVAGVDHGAVGAALKFLALVAVLAVLPGEERGVLFGLNPRKVWLVVVFVAGLSLPFAAMRLGVVLGTVAQLTVSTVVAFTAGVPRMARVVAVILVGGVGAGVGIVLLT